MTESRSSELDAEELVSELNLLIKELEQFADTDLGEKALRLVQNLLDLYGETLRRMIETFAGLPNKDQLHSHLLSDELIRSVLIIHGLMPVELYQRVATALESLRPYLISQGCDVELISVEDGRALIRLIRSGKGAPPVAALKAEIEKSLAEVAPDLAGIEIEGAEQIAGTEKAAALLGKLISGANEQARQPNLIQITRPQPASDGGPWVAVIRALGFDDGQLRIVKQDDLNVLVCRIGTEFYAYKNSCAADDARSFDEALFESPMLTCACHGYRFDLRRGTCIERPELRLSKIPARVEDDKVKVNLSIG